MACSGTGKQNVLPEYRECEKNSVVKDEDNRNRPSMIESRGVFRDRQANGDMLPEYRECEKNSLSASRLLRITNCSI